MYHRIILTGGTSALAPNNLGKWARERSLLDFSSRPPKLPGEQSHQEAMSAIEAACRELPALNPRSASAEISLLHALNERGELARGAQVHLVYSETVDGEAAARIVKHAAEKLFSLQVKLEGVAGLDATKPQAMRAALGRFMNTLARCLEAGEPRSSCFAPLGGYKVMTSLGYLTGAYLGFPTAYLHENQQRLHTIPAVPVKVDTAEMKRVAPLFRKIGEAYEAEKLSAAERLLVEQYGYLFEEEEGLVGVSPFGLFLKARPQLRAVLGTQILGSKQAAGLIQKGNRQWIAQQLETLLNIKDMAARQGEVFHERNFKCKEKPAFHLYKGASNGREVFRAAWRYRGEGDTLEINRLWLDHDLYEREANKCTGLLEPAGDWIELGEDLFGV